MGEYRSAQLDAVFGAVTDPTRRAILARLAEKQARVTEIAAEFPISLNSISKHIKMLERAGLVRRQIVGREHVLSLDAAPLGAVSEWIETYRKFWEGRLEALEKFAVGRGRSTQKRRRK